MKVKIKKTHPNAQIPFKHYEDDHCYDCIATSCEEIAPNVYKYGLGIAVQIDSEYIRVMRKGGYVLSFDLRARSSIHKTGMILSNGTGTIDEGYTNEISAVFYHVVPSLPRYKEGDRICQIKIGMTPKTDFIEVNELEERERGLNGYGSTDKGINQ